MHSTPIPNLFHNLKCPLGDERYGQLGDERYGVTKMNLILKFQSNKLGSN